VQRKVLTPNDFTDLAEVTQRLLGFQHRYEQTAVPFDWRFTRADLDLLRRLDDIEQFANAAGRSPKNFQKEHLGWDVEVQRTASAHGIRHVEDTVDALLGLLDEPSTIGGTFNIGRPRRSPSATSRAASWSAPAAAPRWSRCRTAKPTGSRTCGADARYLQDLRPHRMAAASNARRHPDRCDREHWSGPRR
jgi:hypothetical protein